MEEKNFDGINLLQKKSQSLKINLRKRNVERFLAKEKKNNVSICFVESLNRFWTRQQETVKCFFCCNSRHVTFDEVSHRSSAVQLVPCNHDLVGSDPRPGFVLFLSSQLHP